MTPVEAIDAFAVKVSGIVEQEYGDWMRRAYAYLLELEDELQTSGEIPSKARAIFHELHEVVQFTPDFRIAETLRRVDLAAIELRKIYGADDQLTLEELAVSSTSRTETPAFPPYDANR